MTELLKNNEIKFNKVLVIDPNGQQLGVLTVADGIYEATKLGLDLVCVAPNANPAVCKIMDYGKYKFDLIKKEKQSKKNQHQTEVSEIQLSFMIQDNDMRTKAKTCQRLIEKGNLVRVVLRLRGREVTYAEQAKLKLGKFIELCSEFTKIKKDIFIEGRDIKTILEKK